MHYLQIACEVSCNSTTKIEPTSDTMESSSSEGRVKKQNYGVFSQLFPNAQQPSPLKKTVLQNEIDPHPQYNNIITSTTLVFFIFQ